jgi:hypothetical protein
MGEGLKRAVTAARATNPATIKTIIYGSCPRCNGDGYVVVGRILWNPVKTDCPAESCKDGRVVISVVEERR